MQWSAAPNAGFSAPDTPELWLPLAPDYRAVNVARQLEDPTSLLNLYRRLLAWRKATPSLQWGDYHPLDGMPETCYVFERRAGEERILVALNFSGQDQNLPWGEGRVVMSTHLDRAGEQLQGVLALRGHEGVIIAP
jgi:alpha-glucosidase